jgi:hypothetical protein
MKVGFHTLCNVYYGTLWWKQKQLHIGRQEMDTFKQSDVTLLGESNIHYMLLMLRKLMSPF